MSQKSGLNFGLLFYPKKQDYYKIKLVPTTIFWVGSSKICRGSTSFQRPSTIFENALTIIPISYLISCCKHLDEQHKHVTLSWD